MALTPKNWKSFQHYTNRAPAWIKLHRGLLDDYTFHRLPLASRALAPLLWLLASEYENGEITATFDEIAFRFRTSLDDLTAALNPLITAGFFIASEMLAECKPAACLEREEEEEEEIEKDSRSIEVDRPLSAPSQFDEFWKVYPRRDGPNPRKPAEQKFNALVKSGVDPGMMVLQAKKLNQAESAKGNVGSRFIPQALTWLNQQRWADHAAVAFLASQCEAEMSIEQAVEQLSKLGRWSRYAPCPEPGQFGCKASPELLAKYGLGADGRKIRVAV